MTDTTLPPAPFPFAAEDAPCARCGLRASEHSREPHRYRPLYRNRDVLCGLAFYAGMLEAALSPAMHACACGEENCDFENEGSNEADGTP